MTSNLRSRLRAGDPGWDFIESVLMGAAEEVLSSKDPRGCMLVNVATEFAARDPRIRELIGGGAKRVAQVFVAAVKQAQSEGALPLDKDANVLGRYLLSSLSGLRTMVKAGTRHRAMTDIVGVIMSALK